MPRKVSRLLVLRNSKQDTGGKRNVRILELAQRRDDATVFTAEELGDEEIYDSCSYAT
jgi:hypothetical protein